MKKIIFLLAMVSFMSCSKPLKKIKVTNALPFARKEIISIPISELGVSAEDRSFLVKQDGKILPIQSIDADGDKQNETVLVEVSVDANGTSVLEVYPGDLSTSPDSIQPTYGRFVPERIDDFAWENNRVAFRTYGPEAQRLVDANEKGGTLSSGIDCWLKRVEYPVIDKWYAKNTAGGSYHKDDGEGYDPYHVGASRGCGGLGVLVGDSLYVSKNYTAYKVLANGPLRTIFELTYAPWSANGLSVEERKTISIDHDQQFCKVEAYLKTASPLDYTIGITLHDKSGTTKADSTKGWFRYWEAIDDSELGTGVVIDAANIIRYKDFRTEKKDLSHLYIVSKPANDRLVYYPGFAWKKAGLITTPEAWDRHLAEFSERIHTPLKVEILK
jgi:hypothetical protein